MTTIHRIRSLLLGLVIILFGIVTALSGDNSFSVIVFILGCSFLITGIRYIIYHFRMSRHMVGGKIILFIGVIYFDFGLVTIGLHDSPPVYVVIYLLGFHAFSGMVNILRAREARAYEGGAWRLTMTNGIVNILIAVTAFVFGLVMGSQTILVEIYSLGLLYSGITRIINSMRRTSIVYIP